VHFAIDVHGWSCIVDELIWLTMAGDVKYTEAVLGFERPGRGVQLDRPVAVWGLGNAGQEQRSAEEVWQRWMADLIARGKLEIDASEAVVDRLINMSLVARVRFCGMPMCLLSCASRALSSPMLSTSWTSSMFSALTKRLSSSYHG
jgi:hypothetical protein